MRANDTIDQLLAAPGAALLTVEINCITVGVKLITVGIKPLASEKLVVITLLGPLFWLARDFLAIGAAFFRYYRIIC
jgi:hypothetical protein